MSWGNPRTFSERTLAKLLAPASFAYGTGSYLRLLAYSAGLLKQRQFPVDVISVGNITCGGTGKTPVTIDLAQRLINDGRRVGILSRGYRRLSKEPVVVAGNGEGDFAECTACGDEPYLMARSLPQAVVLVGAKRVVTADIAIRRFGCDTLLLDDGFQHLAMARNTDIVLVDYNDDLSSDRLLPAGRLREPANALARAEWVVVTKVPVSPNLDRLTAWRTAINRYAPQAEVSSCRMVVSALQPLAESDVSVTPATVHGKKVLAFSGIARASAFANQLEELGAEVVANIDFGDHHWYTHEDVHYLRRLMSTCAADLLITTEKDGVKLVPGLVKDLPVSVLKQSLQWLGPLPVQDHQEMPVASASGLQHN